MNPLKELYEDERFKDLFIRSVINSAVLFGLLLFITIITDSTTTNESIDQILFLPLLILAFTAWLIGGYYKDSKDDRKYAIKSMISFVGIMMIIFYFIGDFGSYSSMDSKLTFKFLVEGIFFLWVLSLVYTGMIDFIFGAINENILKKENV
ncbi:MAG: hypothetical protein HeimC3_26060 [Candidatus Heimdallarchaeota archaeon LC_3]|nr:MAG: hypothetical protein HeimC3_26060 [Candidatus Heimdallarchaeota archaeon LC_3]